jgi:hypothetical protein
MKIARTVKIDLSKHSPDWKGYILFNRQSWERHIENGKKEAEFDKRLLVAVGLKGVAEREEEQIAISLERLDLFVEELKHHFIKGELNGEALAKEDLVQFDKEILREITLVVTGNDGGKA